MLADQELALDKVWAGAHPCFRVWPVFGIEWQGYRSIGEILPFMFKWFVPTWQLTISACVIQHMIKLPVVVWCKLLHQNPHPQL